MTAACEEVELKLALRRPAELPRLLAHLPAPEAVVHQRNHYFADPEGRTAAARVMVRAREERPGGPAADLARVVLTVKRRTGRADGLFTASEHEAEIPRDDWATVLSGERDLSALELEPLSVSVPAVTALRRIGSTDNTRHRVLEAGFVLELDETRFPDGSVDAEVEVEAPRERIDEARAVVEAAARRAGVELREQTAGKYARFRARGGSG